MKNFKLSLVAALTMNTFAMAAEDITPAQEMTAFDAIESTNVFYVGLGSSYMNTNIEETGGSGEFDFYGNAFTLLTGYSVHKYIAIEGRYSKTLGNLTLDYGNTEKGVDGYISNISVYIKPMYSIDSITLYGLLGYGKVTIDDEVNYSESGFQWGLGTSYTINNISLFIDYSRLYDDTGFDGARLDDDFLVDSVNAGVTYKF